MLAQYISHDDVTLRYIENALRLFHTFKDVFLLGQAGKKAKAKPNPLKTELIKKRKVDKDTNAETWMPSNKQHEMNTWGVYISHRIDVSKELDADFNIQKIHLMYYWVEAIRRCGTCH
jgi:hypothetical protein